MFYTFTTQKGDMITASWINNHFEISTLLSDGSVFIEWMRTLDYASHRFQYLVKKYSE